MNDTLPRFLATDADVYEHFMGRWSARLAKPLLDFVGCQPGSKVLDVGCGTGTLTLALAQHGARAVGVDASRSYIDGARRLRPHPDIEYELGDARQLPYANASFDACVSMLVIDVVPQVELVAAEMRRVTRPRGVVAGATFDFWGGTPRSTSSWTPAQRWTRTSARSGRRSKPAPSCGRMDKRTSGGRSASATCWNSTSC
jgi:ubiquinone/menaquinone biosynthesis C-methylase UbiE